VSQKSYTDGNDVACWASSPNGYCCSLARGHKGAHVAELSNGEEGDRWGGETPPAPAELP
jgi:hypothetical protein